MRPVVDAGPVSTGRGPEIAGKAGLSPAAGTDRNRGASLPGSAHDAHPDQLRGVRAPLRRGPGIHGGTRADRAFPRPAKAPIWTNCPESGKRRKVNGANLSIPIWTICPSRSGQFVQILNRDYNTDYDRDYSPYPSGGGGLHEFLCEKSHPQTPPGRAPGQRRHRFPVSRCRSHSTPAIPTFPGVTAKRITSKRSTPSTRLLRPLSSQYSPASPGIIRMPGAICGIAGTVS